MNATATGARGRGSGKIVRSWPMPTADRHHDSQSGLDLEWIDDEERWRELRDVWEGLVAASETPSIFNTWDFLEASWEVFAKPSGNRLAILVLREHGAPLGFLPLRLIIGRRLGLPTYRLKRLASWETDRVPFAFPKGREAECAEAVLRFLDDWRDRWDSLELREVAPDGGFLAALGGWVQGRSDLVLHEVEASPSPYVALEGSWEAYLSSLGATTRKGLRRRLKHLGELGPFAVKSFCEPAQIGIGLERYLEVEARSWKPEAGQGIGKNERNQAFYRRLLPRLAAQGRARVALLEQSDRFLAGLVELRLGGTAYASQTAFDRECAHHSPGFVLQALRLECSVQEGVKEYELFAKFLADKLRFTKRLRPSRDVVLLRWRGLRRRLLFTAGRIRRLVRRPRPEGGAAEGSGETESGE